MIDTAAAVASYRADLAANPRKPGRVSTANRANGPAAAAVAKRAKAVAAQADAARTMAEMRRAGMTFGAIADTFNADGITTRYGSNWDAANVKRVIALYA